MSKIVPVVLCGGSGTRLWPRSRVDKPKPFIKLLGEQTLFQATLARCSDTAIFADPVIVVGKKHVEFARPQSAEIAPRATFIIEPMGRNTAPAIAMAAHALHPDDIMLICPSDHHINDTMSFQEAAQRAKELASEDWLVSFGIEATAPETGFGYIRRGESLGPGFRIESFVEKPDLETALSFLAEGGVAWNGGIFALKAKKFLEELARHRPEIARATKLAFDRARTEDQSIIPDNDSFSSIPSESVDYAVMENTDRAAMVDAAMGWSDIGNWDALLQKREPDGSGNVVVGNGEVIDASGVMIDSDGPHVTLIGLDNAVVVVDGEDILVTARDTVQAVGRASRCKNQ